MSYKRWNKALLDYYFTGNDSNKEVLLYCDEEIINEIGKENELGGFSEFINSTLDLEEVKRFEVFDSFFLSSFRRTVSDNRSISNGKDQIFGVFLFKKEDGTKVNLSYFNFIITAIIKRTISNQHPLYERINIPNPTNYDFLIHKISKVHPEFKSGMIGKLRHEGLLNFQVVLNRSQWYDLQCVLYKYQLEFSEEEFYETILNRSKLIERTKGALRAKLLNSKNDECFKFWFENRIKSFNLNEFSLEEDTNDIEVVQQGSFVLAFSNGNGGSYKGLCLLTDVKVEKNLPHNDININVNSYSFKLENDYYSNLILPKEEFLIQEYNITQDNITIQSLPIRDVIILQKTNNDLYVQTEEPEQNKDTYILVKNEVKVIEKVGKWLVKKDIVTNEVDVAITSMYFTDKYKLFLTNNLPSSYYKINNNWHTVKHDKNTITKFGGFKLPDTTDVYLGVALPKFKIKIKEFKEENLKCEISGEIKNIKSIFEIKIFDNVISLYLKDDDYNYDKVHIEINFKYKLREEYKIVATYTFLIVPSKITDLPDENKFYFNEWGRNIPFNNLGGKKYFNSHDVFEIKKENLGNNRHRIEGWVDSHSIENETFINLIAASFNKTTRTELSKHGKVLKDAYESAFKIMNNDRGVYGDNYSFHNLIDNLVYLGFLSKRKNVHDFKGEELIQIIPPTFLKTERSFAGYSQCYLLTGIRTRKFTFLLKEVCKKHDVKMKFLSAKNLKDRNAEYALLPDVIFVGSNFPFSIFKETCKKENVFDGENVQIEKKDEISLGRTLLAFMANVKDFENQFLKGAAEYTNFNEHDLVVSVEEFPRIRKQIIKEAYTPNRYFLETKKGVLIERDSRNELLPKHWLKLYVSYKKQDPVVIFLKGRAQGADVYRNEIYLYKYYTLPFILKRSLTLLNNGLAKEEKVFIKNSNWNESSKAFPFNIFLKYNILAQHEENRALISKILTGSSTTSNNAQVIESRTFSLIKIMYLSKKENDMFSVNDNLILIQDDKKVLSLILLSKKNYVRNCYILSENLNGSNTINVNIDGENITVAEVELEKDKNKLISAIIDGNYSNLKAKINPLEIESNIEIIDYIEEEIKLIEQN